MEDDFSLGFLGEASCYSTCGLINRGICVLCISFFLRGLLSYLKNKGIAIFFWNWWKSLGC